MGTRLARPTDVDPSPTTRSSPDAGASTDRYAAVDASAISRALRRPLWRPAAHTALGSCCAVGARVIGRVVLEELFHDAE